MSRMRKILSVFLSALMIVSAFVGVISFSASAASTVEFDVDTFGLNKTGTSAKIDFRANPGVYEVGDGYNVIWVTTFTGTGYIKYTYEGKEYTFTLPKPEEEGYALRLTPRTDRTLQVAIATTHPEAERLLGYTLVRHGKCELIDTLTMHATSFSRTLSTHKLPTGVYQFSLFDAGGTLYATRMLFINNGVSTAGVSVTSNKKAYAPFEEVKLRLQVEEEGNHYLSLAVRDAADYGTGYAVDLRTYMLLSSELKGYIEHPEYYF